MGPLEQLVKLIPGVGSKLPIGNVDPKRMKHIEAIILSMTPEERKKPEILNGSRRARIAKGSGRPVSEVNRLLKQFKEMQKIMKQMRGFLPTVVCRFTSSSGGEPERFNIEEGPCPSRFDSGGWAGKSSLITALWWPTAILLETAVSWRTSAITSL